MMVLKIVKKRDYLPILEMLLSMKFEIFSWKFSQRYLLFLYICTKSYNYPKSKFNLSTKKITNLDKIIWFSFLFFYFFNFYFIILHCNCNKIKSNIYTDLIVVYEQCTSNWLKYFNSLAISPFNFKHPSLNLPKECSLIKKKIPSAWFCWFIYRLYY